MRECVPGHSPSNSTVEGRWVINATNEGRSFSSGIDPELAAIGPGVATIQDIDWQETVLELKASEQFAQSGNAAGGHPSHTWIAWPGKGPMQTAGFRAFTKSCPEDTP